MENLYLIFKCDAWKSTSSMNLVGVVNHFQLVKKSVVELIKNEVIGEEGQDADSFEIVSSASEYQKLNEIQYLYITMTELNRVEVDGGTIL